MSKNVKKSHHSLMSQKGSVLIMTLIITSGILMIAMEFSNFIASNIRLARNNDRALIARYAAESAIESGLYRLRKETCESAECTTLRMLSTTTPSGVRWTYRLDSSNDSGGNAVDPKKFSPTIPAFEKIFAPKENAIQFSLYTKTDQGTDAIDSLQDIRITWRGIDDACASGAGTPPGIETSVVAWSEGTVQWDSPDVLKNYQQAASTSTMMATVHLDDLKAGLSQQPMVVRIKPYFCDLSSLKITLLSNPQDISSTIPIPNYFLLRPLGVFGGIQQDLQSIVPGQETLSDIFDFALFSGSEDPITKQE